ncbi:MAG: mechanosensitive ion channel family protein [Christensenellales bacterium]|jgi:small conductance mechanosensitive channel|nr:mechanosensitive ion channel [Clostridiales bacterium]
MNNFMNMFLATTSQETANALQKIGLTYGKSILESIALILVGVIVAKLITGIIRTVFSKTKVDGSIVSFMASIAKTAIALLFFFLILKAFKIDPTSIAAIAGASGIAVGFALKDTLSNLASGVMLLITKPFKQDDLVMIGGFTGSVKKITITVTELLTADNTAVIIPNNKIVLNEIVNYSTKPTRRVELVVNIGYKYDMDEVLEILHQAMDSEPLVLKNPAAYVEIVGLQPHAVEYKMKMYTKTEDYFAVRNNFYSTVLRFLKNNGITEARPVYEVIKQENALLGPDLDENDGGDLDV